MNKIKHFDEIEELFNKNQKLLNILIKYCKHDVEKTSEIANIENALEIIAEYHDKIKLVIEKYYENAFNT